MNARDGLLDGTDLPWDAVLAYMPTNAQPGQLVTGLPTRITFRDELEADA